MKTWVVCMKSTVVMYGGVFQEVKESIFSEYTIGKKLIVWVVRAKIDDFGRFFM